MEGLDGSVAASQVLARCDQLEADGHGVRLVCGCMTLASFRRTLQIASSRNADRSSQQVWVFRAMRPSIPGSWVVNSIILLFMIWWIRGNGSVIHARTDVAAAASMLAKYLLGCPLVWDVRGDAVSELTADSPGQSGRRRLVHKVRVIQAKLHRAIASKACDAAICVSRELERLIRPSLVATPSIVIPCAAPETMFHFDSDLQSVYRSRNGISESDVVLVFAGAWAPWQCVDQVVDIMSTLVRGVPDVRCLIATPDAGRVCRLIPTDVAHAFSVKALAHKEVPEWLCIADFAFLLRESSPINWVASPIKFAEYSMSGLHVVTGSAVEQVNDIGQRLSNLIRPEELPDRVRAGRPEQSTRNRIAATARSIMGQASQAERYLVTYSLARRRAQSD